jgi:hypothetical protein
LEIAEGIFVIHEGRLQKRQHDGYGSRLAHALQRTDEGDGCTVATPRYTDTNGIVILSGCIIVCATRQKKHQTADKDDIRHQVSQSFHCLFFYILLICAQIYENILNYRTPYIF